MSFFSEGSILAEDKAFMASFFVVMFSPYIVLSDFSPIIRFSNSLNLFLIALADPLSATVPKSIK